MTDQAKFQDSKRIQESFLAPIEKVALLKLASWMPHWVNPDHLTSIGFLSMILSGLSYYLARHEPAYLFLASFFIVINWFGDSLDGTLARYRKKLRPRYGYYIDHMIDALGTFTLTLGIGLSGYMDLTVAFLLLIAYYLLSIQSYLATAVFREFRISFWKLSPTEVRLLLIAGNAYAFFRPEVALLGRGLRPFDVGAVIAMAGMAAILLYTTIQNTVRLYREERL